MNGFIILCIINFFLFEIANCDVEKLRGIYSWKSLDFKYPSVNEREQAIRNGSFIFGAPFPIDVDVARVGPRNEQKLFITIPRFQNGVPVTLGYVTKFSFQGNPLIAPYPNWEMNTLDGNCNHIISVFRIKVDECNRLWILDTGKLIEDQICPPKILLFDLSNNRLISSYNFPNNQVYSNSLFITPAIDIRYHRCNDAFVYIADVEKYQLIVYDHRNKKSWNIQNKLFAADPNQSNFTINGQSFNLMDGIFGLALGPLLRNNERILYFHSLASNVENFIHTSIIRESRIFEGNPNAASNSFQTFNYQRPSQSAAEAMNKDGILFYSLLSQTALACWNSQNNPELNENDVAILVQNSETLQFPSGLKVSPKLNGQEELWMITVRFQKIATDTINPNETNFRIQAGYVDELIRGSKCAPRSYYQHHHINGNYH
ncbi:hypothetical protein PV328_011492 [Microctonus aethiopoides]|uniref:Bee-milk protein n=1 Tax=Microctonus aethiopoides TaxID=144406 RepID=A0AA39EYK4_9HYME|nr:hypothetical protein PV328_011492 [Microctonus aethiopoides]